MVLFAIYFYLNDISTNFNSKRLGIRATRRFSVNDVDVNMTGGGLKKPCS